LDEVEDDVQLNSRENEEQSSNIPSTNAFDMDFLVMKEIPVLK
jgi:hypothetical protein